MKRFFCLLLLILPFFLSGQQITVSEEVSVRSDMTFEFVGKIKDHYLLLRARNDKYKVFAYNDKMRLAWKKDAPIDKKRVTLMGVASSEDIFSVFYKYRKKGHLYLGVNKYNGTANLIDSMTIKKIGHVFSDRYTEIISSEDENIILIFSTSSRDKIDALAFNIKKMEVLWDKSFQLDDISFDKPNWEIFINNTGTLFLTFDKNNRKSKIKDHHFLIFENSKFFEKLEQHKINFPNGLTYDVHFIYDNLNNNLVAGGLYALNNRGRAIGYFYLNIPSPSFIGYSLSLTLFDKDFMVSVINKEKRKIKGLENIVIQDVLLRRDGGALIIAEKQYQYRKRGSSSAFGYNPFYEREPLNTSIDFYNENLLVIAVGKDGAELWKKVLQKKQYARDADYTFSSFFIMKTNLRLRFLYNDEIRYENTVSEYVLNNKGKTYRKSILNTKNLDLRLLITSAVQTGAREIIVPSESKNKLRLVKIAF